jgi:E3 ubiquitin-protein ligase ATL6/9/15/31/42/55
MTDCSICMDAMCNEDVTHTKCKHLFHTNCLKKWTALNTNCPLCRTQIVSEPVQSVTNPRNWFMSGPAYFQHNRGY